MPLNEISSNIDRSPSNKHDGVHKAPIRPPSSHSFAKPPPLAVQSMLKSGTELGDMGIFAQRPPRVPRSATQTSLAQSSCSGPSSSLRHRSFRQDGRPDGGSQRRCYPPQAGIQRKDSTRSSRSAYNKSGRRRYMPNPYPYRYHQYVGFEPSYQRSLHNHRSIASLRSPSEASFRRPHQAILRHDPRAPSPATSNVYEYRYPSSSRQNSFRSDLSFPLSSPLPLERHQDHRRPLSSARTPLRNLSPTGPPGIYGLSVRQPSFMPIATPVPETGELVSTSNVVSPSTTPASPTESIVPFYYDYSESFHGREALLHRESQCKTDEELIAQVGDSMSNNFNQAVQDTANGMLGSRSRPVELPTKHNRRPSKSSGRHSRRTSSKSSRNVHVALAQSIEEETVEQHTSRPFQQQDADKGSNSTPDAAKEDEARVRKSTHCTRDWPSRSASTFFVNASRSPRNLPDLAARAHSPETDPSGVGSIDAVTHHIEADQEQTTTPAQTDEVESGFHLLSFKFRPLSIRISPFSRPSTSPITHVRAASDIVSPHPSRPTSSQSRKRFSKILDIDQNSSFLEYYTEVRPPSDHRYRRLEKVEEGASSPGTTTESSLVIPSTSRKPPRSALSVGPPSTRERWSGVTSHDKSTVDSLLEKHIECLGLKPKSSEAGQPRMNDGSTTDLDEVFKNSRKLPHEMELSSFSETLDLSDPHRPTSLTSTAQRQLMPRKLFAKSVAEHEGAKFPLASSESDPRFSLAWTDEKTRPSYGWLTLPSSSNLPVSQNRDSQTVLSGELADIESIPKRPKFKLNQNMSSTSACNADFSGVNARADPLIAGSLDGHDRSAERDTLQRDNSRKHRKMKIHIRTKTVPETSLSGEWESTNSNIADDADIRRFGMTRVPISAVDGFAELSGESAGASLRSLDSRKKPMMHRSPDTWSTILAAMPLPKRRIHGLKRQDSARTVASSRSQQSIVDPVNTSRPGAQAYITQPQTTAPGLARPDLGPSMRASQFDLSQDFKIKSPKYKQSSFSEPNDLLQASPPPLHRKGTHNREKFYSFRNVMPSSMRSFTFSPDRTQKPYSLAQACQTQRSASLYDQPILPETAVMSDFAYRRHKLIEKLKGWCRRRRVQKQLATRKRRSVPSGGFIV